MEVIDINLKKMAANLRDAADEIERGDFIAFALVGCDAEGTAHQCCMVDQHRATHDLLDEMVYSTKQMLFESFEDGK